jgi:hypothetical protein
MARILRRSRYIAQVVGSGFAIRVPLRCGPAGSSPTALDRHLGCGVRDQQTVAKTLRRILLALRGRLTRTARRSRLRLPVGWPWAHPSVLSLA